MANNINLEHLKKSPLGAQTILQLAKNIFRLDLRRKKDFKDFVQAAKRCCPTS